MIIHIVFFPYYCCIEEKNNKKKMATSKADAKDQTTLPGNRRAEINATINAQDRSPNCRYISLVNNTLEMEEHDIMQWNVFKTGQVRMRWTECELRLTP